MNTVKQNSERRIPRKKFRGKSSENRDFFPEQIWSCDRREGRVCLSIEFEFVSTNMGLHFSTPIEPINRLVLEKTWAPIFELWVCRLTRENLNEVMTLSLSGSSNLWVSVQIFPQHTESIDGQTRPSSGSFLSVDRLSVQHLVCRCFVFHRSILLENLQKAESLKIWRSGFSIVVKRVCNTQLW